MAYIALNTFCLFPSVVDDIILSYIHDKTKAQWQAQFKHCISFINELDEDIDMVLRKRHIGHLHYGKKKYYSIYN
jgi:hypothetical protein